MKIYEHDAGHMTKMVCSNYDPGLTLTYFTARSNFATYAFLHGNM